MKRLIALIACCGVARALRLVHGRSAEDKPGGSRAGCRSSRQAEAAAAAAAAAEAAPAAEPAPAPNKGDTAWMIVATCS